MAGRRIHFVGLVFITVTFAASLANAQKAAEQKNMVLIGHSDLNGHGDGGEGTLVQQRPDGRRILYMAHWNTQTCLSIVDVTHPENPMLLNQLPSPGPGAKTEIPKDLTDVRSLEATGTRCNSLGLSGNVLAVANQTYDKGAKPAGMWLLDVSDLDRVQKAKTMQDLAFSFFDTSGPNSRGVHWLWFSDGEFVHMSTGAADSNPSNPKDHQFYMIVDVREPRHPREVGRWWLPGTQKGDECLPGCLPERQQPIDHGYKLHSVEVFPERPDRAYIGYIDGGQIILDISGLADVRAGRAKSFSPKLVSRLKFQPPFPGFTHTVNPIFSRGLAEVIEETTLPKCADSPKFVWLVDIRAEKNPVIVGTAPFPENSDELCKRGGRSGAHNLAIEYPTSTSAHLKNTFVGTFFNAGVRIYRLVNQPVPYPHAPPRIEEIGYFIPPVPPRNPGFIEMNHVFVDEMGLIYANDDLTGGLYILKYTGPQPLD